MCRPKTIAIPGRAASPMVRWTTVTRRVLLVALAWVVTASALETGSGAWVTRDSVLKEGILIGAVDKKFTALFIKAIAQHRFWEREKPRLIPA